MPIIKVCEQCGTDFSVKPSHQARRFCTKSCVTAHEAIHGRIAARVAMIEFSCKECGNPFAYKPSAVAVYRNKYGRDPLYCSMPCSDLGRRKDTMERQRFTCEQCGKEQSRRRKPGGRVYMQQRFCDRSCKAAHQRANALTKFERGEFKRHVKRHGYVWISVPSLVTGKKHAVMEHRYVMSKCIGRELFPEETVHHINGIRSDNSPDNLELFSSRHGPGQRVVDKVQFAIEILTLYPEFARSAGYELHKIVQVSDSPASRPASPVPSA